LYAIFVATSGRGGGIATLRLFGGTSASGQIV
jgi:hypothetical protein